MMKDKLHKCYYDEGLLNRDNGPAYTEFYESGFLKVEQWLRMGVVHRDDGPACVVYFEDGRIKSETWYKFGNLLELMTQHKSVDIVVVA